MKRWGEFVLRHVCATEKVGSKRNGEPILEYIYAAESVDEPVDYGIKYTTVKYEFKCFAVINAIETFSREESTQSNITMYLEMGVKKAYYNRSSVLVNELCLVAQLRETFQRDRDLDQLQLVEASKLVKEEAQAYTVDENKFMDLCNNLIGQDALDKLQSKFALMSDIELPDHFVKMRMVVDNAHSGTVMMETILDVAPEECASFDLVKVTRDNSATHGYLFRNIEKINNHSFYYHVVFDLNVANFKPREFVYKAVWKWITPTCLQVAYMSIGDPVKFPENPKYVRGESLILWQYDVLPPLATSNIPQTRVKWNIRHALGGNLPNFAVNKNAVNQAQHLTKMRKKFDKSTEIDTADREKFISLITDHYQSYEEQDYEKALFQKGADLLRDFTKLPRKRKVKSSSPAISSEIHVTPQLGWGRSQAVVRASKVSGMRWSSCCLIALALFTPRSLLVVPISHPTPSGASTRIHVEHGG